MSKRDYYELMGVAREASADEINKAFRKLALQWHPDRNHGCADAAEKFKELNEANDVLSNPDKRRRYDRYGHDGLQNGGSGNEGSFAGGAGGIFEFFEDFFSGGQRGPRGGRDIQVIIDLTLKEAYQGVRKSVTYQREENCPECQGNGLKRSARPPMCRRCQGQGVEVVRGMFGLPQQQRCRHCNGVGAVVSEGDFCPACRGKCRTSRAARSA